MKASAYSRPLIPKPVSVAWVPGAFHLTPRVGISWSTDHAADAPELGRIADMLAERMRVATGFPFPCAASATSAPATIHLSIETPEPLPQPLEQPARNSLPRPTG